MIRKLIVVDGVALALTFYFVAYFAIVQPHIKGELHANLFIV